MLEKFRGDFFDSHCSHTTMLEVDAHHFCVVFSAYCPVTTCQLEHHAVTSLGHVTCPPVGRPLRCSAVVNCDLCVTYLHNLHCAIASRKLRRRHCILLICWVVLYTSLLSYLHSSHLWRWGRKNGSTRDLFVNVIKLIRYSLLSDCCCFGGIFLLTLYGQ